MPLNYGLVLQVVLKNPRIVDIGYIPDNLTLIIICLGPEVFEEVAVGHDHQLVVLEVATLHQLGHYRPKHLLGFLDPFHSHFVCLDKLGVDALHVDHQRSR